MAEFKGKRMVAEFLAIFAGVTLGLFADDWRERRGEAEDARPALNLLHDDLVADSAAIAVLRGPLQGHVNATVWLQGNWEEPSPDRDTLGLAFKAYAYANSWHFRSSAFSSLKDGDRLSLVRNDSLRAALMWYHEESQPRLELYLESHIEDRNQFLDLLSPHVILPPGREPGSLWPFANGPLQLTSPWSRIREENVLRNQATIVGLQADLAVQFLDQALESNAALREAIRVELGRN